MKHLISVLVENKFGTLNRVAAMFSARGFNLESISIGESEDPEISRMTIVTRGDDRIIRGLLDAFEKESGPAFPVSVGPHGTQPPVVLIPVPFQCETEIQQGIVEQFPADVFETIIAKTIRFSESSVQGEPITQYANNSGAANSYRRLARELISRGGAK